MNDVTQEIEKRIDRQVAGALMIGQHGAGAVIAPRDMGQLMEFAKLMAISGVCVRPQFRGNPGSCLAIAIQAMKWGADPFAVANKAYVVKNNRTGEESLAYEAQLIHAIVNSSPALSQRLRPVYTGEGQERRCRIVGHLNGEEEALEYESPPIRLINPKNSPLWTSDPDQQLFYYSTRAWARRHVPEILLGIYAPEEWAGETIELEPQPEPRREDFTQQHAAEPEPKFAVWTLDGAEELFASPARAAEALTLILQEAAKISPAQLEASWGDNDELITALREGGHEQAANDLAATYADLVVERQQQDAPKRRQRSPRQAQGSTAEGSPGRDGATARSPATGPGEPARGDAQQQNSPTGAQDEREERLSGNPPVGDASTEPAQADTVGRPASPIRSDDRRAPAEAEGDPGPGESLPPSGAAQDDRFPGDLPAGQKLGDPPTSAGAAPATDHASPASGPADGTMSASNGPTATSAASSPSEGEEGIVGDGSRVIPMVLRVGKPDPKAWLIAMLGPKMRQCKTTRDLAMLLGDNAENIDQAMRVITPPERKEFEAQKLACFEQVKRLEASGNG